MKQFQNVAKFLGVIAVLTCLVFGGCAGPQPKPGEVFPCAAESQIEKTIAPEAELTDFSCVMKKWEGSETLHYNVTLKNVSGQPQRYKVNIFMDNGKAVGGLIPRKTKGGLIEPGQSASFEYPVSGMADGPTSIMLMVKTMSE